MNSESFDIRSICNEKCLFRWLLMCGRGNIFVYKTNQCERREKLAEQKAQTAEEKNGQTIFDTKERAQRFGIYAVWERKNEKQILFRKNSRSKNRELASHCSSDDDVEYF